MIDKNKNLNGAGKPLIVTCPKRSYRSVLHCLCCELKNDCPPGTFCVKSKYTRYAYHGVCGKCDTLDYPRIN